MNHSPSAGGVFEVMTGYSRKSRGWTEGRDARSVTPVDLSPWPTITAYQKRLHERPSVARAFAEERRLYGQELARHKAEQEAT
jgi:hypothetical protein